VLARSRLATSETPAGLADRSHSLAYAELYLVLAAILRRFDFTLVGTTREDVEAVRDAFVPMPKKSSKGVRVQVHNSIPV